MCSHNRVTFRAQFIMTMSANSAHTQDQPATLGYAAVDMVQVLEPETASSWDVESRGTCDYARLVIPWSCHFNDSFGYHLSCHLTHTIHSPIPDQVSMVHYPCPGMLCSAITRNLQHACLETAVMDTGMKQYPFVGYASLVQLCLSCQK